MTLQEIVNDGQSGFVEVPLKEWRKALSQAVPPNGDDEESVEVRQIISDLKTGAMRAGNVSAVGIDRDQAKMVLGLIPAPAPAPVPAPVSSAVDELPVADGE